MDSLSAKMFGSPAVTVGGYEEYAEEILEACRAIFGRPLMPEELAELIAAPDGSALLISARHGDGDIEIRLGYEWFNGTHDYRLYRESETGRRIIEFEQIKVQSEAPELLETRLFARQIRSFRAYALDEVRLFAEGCFAGHPGGIIGYYVWARLGFVMDLGQIGVELARASFDEVDNTLDLFSREGGDRWWYNHGSERPAVFYLDDGSPCVLALEAYLKERGVSVDE